MIVTRMTELWRYRDLLALFQMDNKRAQELAEDADTRDDDSIPLADDDPSAVLEEALGISEDRRRELEWRRKMDFESLDSIPAMLSEQGAGQLSDHMTRMCLDPDFSPVIVMKIFLSSWNYFLVKIIFVQTKIFLLRWR